MKSYQVKATSSLMILFIDHRLSDWILIKSLWNIVKNSKKIILVFKKLKKKKKREKTEKTKR